MMKNTLSRRSLLKRSAAGAAALGLSGLTARSYAQVAGSNEDIRVAVVGFNSRGGAHIDGYRRLQGVRLVALCDADTKVLDAGYKRATSELRPTSRPARQRRPSTQPTASLETALPAEP